MFAYIVIGFGYHTLTLTRLGLGLPRQNMINRHSQIYLCFTNIALPVGGRRDTSLAVENKRTERQWVAKFAISLCRWPSMHNNATYIILKLTCYTRLPTKFRRLLSKIYVFISQVKKISNITYMHTKVIEIEVKKMAQSVKELPEKGRLRMREDSLDFSVSSAFPRCFSRKSDLFPCQNPTVS